MSVPTISIVTAVYNGLPFLKECIDSVCKQRFSNWELIISDDGSSDGSREYLDSLKDNRIRVYKQDKNLGIFGNLNFLFRQAKAPVTQILCQDDYFIDEHSLGRIAGYWDQAKSSLGFVRFNHCGKSVKKLVAFEKDALPAYVSKGNGDVWFFIFGNIPGNLSNLSLRTHIVAQVGWFNQQLPYAGDFDFWCRAAREFDWGVNQTDVVFVRRHAGAASNYLNKKGELVRQRFGIVDDLYKHLLKAEGMNAGVLKLHGTLNYDTQERELALKQLLRGKTGYWYALKKNTGGVHFLYPGIIRWMLFFISAGGRYGRISSARKVIRNWQGHEKNETADLNN